jgi:hypothetical protein
MECLDRQCKGDSLSSFFIVENSLQIKNNNINGNWGHA